MKVKQSVLVISIILCGAGEAIAMPSVPKTTQTTASTTYLTQNTYNPESRTIQGGNENNTFTLNLSKRAFQQAGRQISQRSDGFYLVDGMRPIGIASMRLPREELASFDVQVNGKRWVVPAQLWRDCYEPNLGKVPGNSTRKEMSYVQAGLSKDGQRLTVKMLGSDGAGSYTVTWNLREDGNHSRDITATN
jgi:hypothetical protein